MSSLKLLLLCHPANIKEQSKLLAFCLCGL